MIKLRSILILLCAWISVQSSAQISTDTFYVSQDSYVNSGSPTSTYETDTSLYIYQDTGATVKVYRSILQFDVSSIPSNAIIVSATLRLTKHSTVDSLDHDIYIERMDSIWYDDSITWNNQSGAYLSDQLSFTDAETSGASPHEFDVTDHVEHFVWYQHLNNGWRIRLQDESDTSDYGMIYYSSDHDTAEWRPHLEVQYIMPLDITVNTKHCTNGNNDGSFELDLAGGSQGPLDFFWLYSYDGTVATIINAGSDPTTEEIENDTLSPGLYLLVLRDSLWNVYPENKFAKFYKWFIIGEEGETHSIDWYRQSEWYHNDVALVRSTQTQNNPNWQDNNNDNQHHIGTGYALPTPTSGYDMAGLIQYQMDFDPSLEFDTAQLILNKHGGYYRSVGGSNAVYFRRVTSWWDDKITTWNTRPIIDSTYIDTLGQTEPVGSHNDADTLDVINNIEYWQQNPELNYGLEFAVEFGQTTTNYRFWRGGMFGAPTGPRLKLSWSVKPPLSIDGVVHHCTNGNDDGEIEVSVYEGKYVIDSYKWHQLDSGTVSLIEQGSDLDSAAVDSLENGLYVFSVYENSELIDYKYFLVGEEGQETTVQFHDVNTNAQFSSEHNEDAIMRYYYLTEDGSVNNDDDNTLSAYSSFSSKFYEASLLKYKVDFLPELDFTSSSLYMESDGTGGHYRQDASVSNAGYISRVSSGWEEEVVTWDSRPSIDSTMQITIPETGTTGFVVRNDTFDLSGFVDYWQEHPDENFGIELSLQDYSQGSKTFRLLYRSSDVGGTDQRPIFELKYNLKPPVSGYFNEETGLGYIDVVAPLNEELPYKFLLGNDTLPELDTIWFALKDSVAFDSASFYQGNVNSNVYRFKELEAGHYFIGVYDNSGDKILDGDIVLSPEVYVFDSKDVTETDTSYIVTSPATSGHATLLGLLPEGEDGGIEFEIADLNGDFLIGFNSENDTIPYVDSLLEFGVSIISAASSYRVYKSGNVLMSGSVSVGDKIKIQKRNGNLEFYIGGNLRASTEYNNTEGAYKVDIVLKSSLSLVAKPYFIGNLLKPVPIVSNINYPICPSTTGSVDIEVVNNGYFKYQNTSYTIYDVLTGSALFTGSTSGSHILPIGIYNVVYSYDQQIGGLWASLWGGSEEFTIGYPVDWFYDQNDPNLDNINEISYSLNDLAVIDLAEVGNAISTNATTAVSDWWYNFKINGGSNNLVWEYSNIILENTNGTALELNIQPYNYQNVITKFLWLNNSQIANIHNNRSITIQEVNGQLSVNNSGSIILPTNGVAYTNPISGPMMISVEQKGKVITAQSLVSFCLPDLVVDNEGYGRVKPDLDGSFYMVGSDMLKFEVDGEYYLPSTTYLDYAIYSIDRQLMAAVTDNGTTVVGGAPLVTKNISENGYEIDLSQLSLPDGFYILETTTVKGEKMYLRFKLD